uniref:KRAB-A domain-containing protein 2 n=1 Tax=Cacopsylla melanoneura TaxID=428564 RepID=A0A8D8Q4X0_9HEMI
MSDIDVLAKMRSRFYDRLSECIEQKSSNHLYISDGKYKELIKEVREAKAEEKKKTIHYRRLKRFDIMTVDNQDKLIVPIATEGASVLYYVPYEELFDVINETHISVGHGGRNRILAEAGRKYKNVSSEAVLIYLRLCEACEKKQKSAKRLVKPIFHSEMNSRAQVDLINMQSNPDKFIFVYQDHLTKFVILRALRTKTAEEVAYNLLDIFTTFGAPCILHSDNGREFCNKVIQNMCEMWGEMKIVHGKPRHSQSQGSVERANQDIENMLATWMETNKTSKWSEGLKFVQAMKNRAYHDGIKSSPYEIMFGVPMRMGLATSVLPRDAVKTMNSEEDLETVLSNITISGNENELNDQEKDSDDDAQDNDMEDSVTSNDVQDSNDKVPQLPGTSESNQDRINKVRKIREAAREGLEIQAKKMKKISNEKFPDAQVGQNVRIKVPDVDRAKIDPKSIIAVIIKKEDELYQLGTKLGIINSLYSRNQFTVCSEIFISLEDVKPEEISLRSVVSKQSLVGGQGFKKCTCLKKCITKKCICRGNNMKCNSKCHGSDPCTNK